MEKLKNAIHFDKGQAGCLGNGIQLNPEEHQRRSRTLALIEVQGQTKAPENPKRSLDVSLADGGVGRTKGEEIMEVMENRRNRMIMDEDPLDRRCHLIEDEGG